MGGINKIGTGGVDHTTGADMADQAAVEVEALPEAVAIDPAKTQAAWDAHAADVGSTALQATLAAACAIDPSSVAYDPDYLTLEEFYASMPPEVKELDGGVEAAEAYFKKFIEGGPEAVKTEGLTQEERSGKFLIAMTALAIELRKSPPDLATVEKLSDAADAAVLDYASKGDPAKRAIMAQHFGRSFTGGGAFGNDVQSAFRANPSLPPGALPTKPTTIPAAPAPTSPAQQSGASQAQQSGASPASQAGPSQAAQNPIGSQNLGPAVSSKDTEGSGGAPASYGSLEGARNGAYIRKGQSSDDVRALQEALNAAGANPPLELDGSFGPATDAALKAFQSSHGCGVDGIVGPETMAALDGALGLPARAPSSGGGGNFTRLPGQGPGQLPGGGTIPGAPPPSGPTTGAESRRAALASAHSQRGVREATGNNDGVPASRYSNGSNVPWCANFVSWNFRQAGNPLPGNQVAIGSCDTMANELKRAGMWIGKQTPQPGDVIFFGTPGDYTHVGIVDRVENGRVHTVEGNSGNRVAQQSYPLNASNIQGYGRPT